MNSSRPAPPDLRPSQDERNADAQQAAAPAPGREGVPFDDEWRRWLAENLMLDQPPDGILRAMIAAGIPAAVAARELDEARRSPYVRGAALLRERLKKREWLLAAYRKVNRLLPRSSEVERRHKLSRGEFLAEYYSTNRPVIITEMMDDWPAMTKWGVDYFDRMFGEREIELQVGRTAGDNYEIEREKYLQKMRLSDFLTRIASAGVTNDLYLTANNSSANKKALPELWDDIVQVPEYLDPRGDRAGGFFWMGPPGTITPFHHDLTNNFMAQVLGRKRVKIAPSWDLPLMGNHYHVYSRVDGRVRPPTPNPAPDEAQVLECILHPGEMLFLPIGCMHFVEGLDVSVTVSFTNFVFDNEFTSFYSTYHAV
ncbi:cupin-like domain-containing protein [Paludisphaera soli]|uniref:cupin-like domain-containing protein n=1 Tax=Paludisphaera soli TaxID=2712865 RepID=UPI0013ECB261|nr:cupin-like domain-containing protein [Paludisphaera soli]